MQTPSNRTIAALMELRRTGLPLEDVLLLAKRIGEQSRIKTHDYQKEDAVERMLSVDNRREAAKA